MLILGLGGIAGGLCPIAEGATDEPGRVLGAVLHVQARVASAHQVQTTSCGDRERTGMAPGL
jgi:hypothetical protein